MASELLSTKLRIPPRSQHLVHRGQLIRALDDAIPRHKLTLVSAPAGFGKTTLLADWARASSAPVAWVSLDDGDNDLERFFRYLVTAWDAVLTGVRESSLGVLLGTMMPDRDAVLTAFINFASDLPEQTIFVLDDYHLIVDPTIHDALTFLLDNLPVTVAFVVAWRSEPPLPLARYRARRELVEFRAEDLRFELDEIDAFLNDRMQLGLDEATIQALHAPLEGWIAGTQMAALTLRRHPETPADRIVSGRHRFIADYLSQDVLAGLPNHLRSFLLSTSILDRLSASLCTAVTGESASQSILEALERENLFIVPLDDNREWYRYHRLFSDFLHEELQRSRPDEITQLHQRAAGWYLEHDLPEPAFEHALAGHDLDRVTDILDRYETAKLHGGELHVLRRWINAIPAEWYAAYPLFGLNRAAVSMYEGTLEDGVHWISMVDQRLTATEAPDWQQARVTAFRCFVACFANELTQAERYADSALRYLRLEDEPYRASIYHALGETYSRNGRWREAQHAYRKVLEHPNHYAAHIQSAHVFGALADLALRQGRLRDADDTWQRALAIIQEPQTWGHIPLPVVGWLYVRTAELRYERNDLAGAWQRVSDGLVRAELGGDVRSLIAGYLLAGRIKLTERDMTAATEYLERTRPLVEHAPFPEWISRFERLQLELWLAQNRLRAAVDWSDTMIRDETLAQRPEPEVGQLSIARLLIVRGDAASPERALGLLGQLLRHAEADGRMGIQIETLALQALAYWQRGERAEALPPLARALRLAEPEGYQRTFADLGLPMVRLLQEADSRGIMPEYVTTLLAACGSAGRAEPALPDPLTDREQEILSLLAAGLTNREIADRLFISAETVKKHTGNIYGKLGARGRTEAVARARALDVLA